VLSINHVRSILGASGRYEGIIALSNYFIIFLIVANFYKYNKKHIIFVAITAGIICIHSILFYYNIHLIPINIEESRGGAEAAWSLVGNRNFLGSYITLVFPLFIYLFIKSGNKLILIINWLVFATLVCSLTRSAYLSFAFYMIFFIIYFFLKKKYIKHIITLLISFIFVFALLCATGKDDFLSKIFSIQQDTVSFVKTADDSAGSFRSFIWKRAMTLVPKYALHGSGPDTFDIPFMQAYMKDIKDTFGHIIIFDKAHNEYLQIAVTMGIPALVTYLLFIALLLWKSFKTSKNIKILIPLNICIIAYLIQAFFNFSVVAVAPLYWALLGVIVSYIKTDAPLLP